MLSYYHLIGIVVFLINTQFSFISCAAPAPLTQAQKLAWLNDHNVVRCDANAVTMPALIWDDALEKTAQEYVNTCPSGHNANRQSRYVFYSGLTNIPGVGENYAAGYQTALAVDAAWASEKPSMGGHYTQMVWATTTRVGCALNNVSCGGYGTYWICDYYPPGNYIGQQPFTPGGTAGSTEACQKKSRTDFPVMVWNNGVGTVVDGLNGGTTTTQVPTQAPTPAPTQAPTQPPTQAPTQAPTVAPTTPTPTTPAPTPVWQSFAGYDSYPGQNAAVLSGTTASAAQSYAQSRSYPGFVLCSNTAYFRAASQSPGLTAQSLYTNRVSNGGCTLYIYAVAGSLTSSI